MTIEKALNWLTVAVTIATAIRVILYRAPDLLKLFIPPASSFWLKYAKMVEASDVIIGWLSGALAKFGKSEILQPEHLEWLRDRTPPARLPPLVPPVPTLDAAEEEPKKDE